MSYGIVAALAIGLAGVFYVQAADYPNAAAELPQLLAYIVVALAILIIVERTLRRGGAGASILPDRARIARMAAFSAALIAYVLMLEVAGYVVATVVFLLGCFLATQALSWPRALLVTGAVTVVIYGVFVAFLRLPLDLVPAW